MRPASEPHLAALRGAAYKKADPTPADSLARSRRGTVDGTPLRSHAVDWGEPMAEPLLQRIHAEIRERLRDAEPAVQEYTRLETALAALDGVAATGLRHSGTAAAAP